MEFRILGPLQVVDEGHPVDVGAAKQRALLAVLLLHANRVVSSDHLIEALWGERAPETAQKALQVYVSQLRKTLGRERILTRAPGYELRVEPGELDRERFEQLASAGDLDAALRLWRGPPLADFAYEPFAQGEIARLEERRSTLLEERIERHLAGGRQAALVGELESLVREHPLRERLRGQLMLALYRSGRQAEALDVYQAGRTLLSEGLGLEPSAELRELQRAILAQDPSLDVLREPHPRDRAEPPPASAPSGLPGTREVRKTVTVLSCEVTTSGAQLDPESLRRITARGFEDLVPVLEHHGATVERSLAGAITALFGIPTVHEDDALRAARAASEMVGRLTGLRDELERHWGTWLELRVGISTGEVVAGGTTGQPSATGNPVHAALRLQQAATPGGVLLDARTLRLVRDAVDAEPSGENFRLVDVRSAAPSDESRFDSPMVGRERERRRLHDAFEQAIVSRSSQLFTLLGAPGVGKSRLVREFVQDLAGRALVAQGRCLPYGEGITYWPVLEVVRDVAGLDDTLTAEESLSRLAGLLPGGEDAEVTVQRLGEVIGLSEELGGPEEGFWAVRTFFEALAQRQPLVLVFDDIHWGEETFLDLIDHLADWGRDAPILIVCIARPELLDVRSQWGGGKINATSALLEPLSEAESAELLDNLAGVVALQAAPRRQIVEAAGGNPLFVEEMVALLLEDGRGETPLEVPPTIQALLAARLDRLGDEERSAIEAAAVEGKVFHHASVADLVTRPLADVLVPLQTLVRKELIRSDRPVFSDERAYRFRHILIRDAAYESIPKERRAALHERHAVWLERKVGDRSLEFEEILGYHLEQAFRYHVELGPPDDAARDLALGAGRRLASAARRALARGDTPAAINLGARAAALLPADDPLRVHVVPGVRIVQGLGRELDWAVGVLRDAKATGDAHLVAHARVQEALLQLFTEPAVDADGLTAVATEAIAVFERLDDDLGLARAWRLRQQAAYLGRQSAASADAAEEALRYARRAEDALEEVEIMTWLGVALFMGATPAPEAERRLESHLGERRASRTLEALLLGCLAPVKAMQGQIAEARALLAQARTVVDDLAYLSQLAVVPFHWGVTERLAGDSAAAERVLRASLGPLEEVGETSTYCSIVAVLAQAVSDQGRFEEAEELTRISERHARLNDVHAQVTWRPVRAKALARRGRLEDALALAEEAIAFAAQSDFLNAHGDALLDLAEILELDGRPGEAADTVESAIELYERKGNVVTAASARARLERLRTTA